MTEAGVLLGLLSLAGIIGSVIGGGLTDRLGRRKLILFGLVASAMSALTLGSVNRFAWLFPAAALVGLFSEVGGPAHAAMIADILPKEQRQEGFGILRVVGNMAWLVGPTVGGFVARSSFFALFVIDAVISCVVALLFYAFMPETKPSSERTHDEQRLIDTFRNYRIVLRDKSYVAFLLAAVLMGMVYIQMYNSLSVYLRDNHGIEPQGYGFLLTASAITVICFQFWTMRIIKMRPQFLMMAVGTVFYLIGFGMFGVVSAYWLFTLAVVIITIGEMIVVPTSQTVAAGFASVDMRGRYMAVFGLAFSIPAPSDLSPPVSCSTITGRTCCGTGRRCCAHFRNRFLRAAREAARRRAVCARGGGSHGWRASRDGGRSWVRCRSAPSLTSFSCRSPRCSCCRASAPSSR